MATYTKPQQRKKEESETLRGEGYQITLINIRFEIRLQILAKQNQTSPENKTSFDACIFEFVDKVIAICLQI